MNAPNTTGRNETTLILVKSYPIKNTLTAFLKQQGITSVEAVNASDAIHHMAKHGIPDSFIVCDAIGEKKEAVRLLLNIQKLTKNKHIPSVVILTDDKSDYFNKIPTPDYIKGVRSLPSIIQLKNLIMEAHNDAKVSCIDGVNGNLNGQVSSALSQSELVSQIDKAMNMFDDVVKKVAENKLPGPIMPGLLQEVREVIDKPDISFKKLGDFIRKHQSLALKILATVNSAYYSRGTKVETVEQAISTLGLKMTNSLMQSVAALQYVVGKDEETQDLIKESLRKAYLVALTSQTVSEFENYSQADKVFSVALFHNLGATFLFYTYALMIDKGELQKLDAQSLKTIAIKCMPKLNRTLCRKIKLPQEISLLYNEGDMSPESKKIITLLNKSIYLAETMLESEEDIRISSDSKMLEIDDKLIARFNSNITNLRTLISEYI